MMLEANQSFTYTDDDGTVRAVHRGRTRASSDHPLAQDHPTRFAPLPDTEPWALRHADDNGSYRLANGRCLTDAVAITRAIQESRGGKP